VPAVVDTKIRRIQLRALHAVEKPIRRFSLVGDKEFFDPHEFPWVADIEARWREVRAELDRVLEHRDAVPNIQDISVDQLELTQDDRWKSFFFYGYGVRNDANCRICPRTAELIEAIPGMTTAFFSILLPQKRLPPHRGAYKGVLRYHLGLMIPDPANCAIRVGGRQEHWREGESLIFDDTFNHAAWNATDQIRVVLIVDFRRPLPFPVSLLNDFVIHCIRSSAFVQIGAKRMQQWNERFEEAYHRLSG
jgi:beta-hydroxylase